jgi:hypothetical protein
MNEKPLEKRIVVKIESLINRVVVVGNDVDYEKVEKEMRLRLSSVLEDIIHDLTTQCDIEVDSRT